MHAEAGRHLGGLAGASFGLSGRIRQELGEVIARMVSATRQIAEMP